MENFNFFKKGKEVVKKITTASVITGAVLTAKDSLKAETPILDDAKNIKTEESFSLKDNKEDIFDLNNQEFETLSEQERESLFGPGDFSFEKADSVPDLSQKYGYKQLGTRKLIGKERPYFGSEKTSEKGPFYKKIGQNEKSYLLGHVYPNVGVNGKALFYNYGPDGFGHICEIEGDTPVFRDENGKVYALICGNLLEFITTGSDNVPEKTQINKPQKERIDQPVYNQPKVDVKKQTEEQTVKLALMVTRYNWNRHQGRPSTLTKLGTYSTGTYIHVPVSQLPMYLQKGFESATPSGVDEYSYIVSMR